LFDKRFTNKKSIRIKKFEKDKKIKNKKMMMMIWLHQEETKKKSMFREKKKRNGEHIRGK